MFRKLAVYIFLFFLIVNSCGCVALIVGAAAGGVGTAVWLSGKLSQEVSAPMDWASNATKSALDSLKLKMSKETIKPEVIQIMSNYTDGRVIWIDIHRISDRKSRIEVRVGAAGDKEVARKILDKITQHL